MSFLFISISFGDLFCYRDSVLRGIYTTSWFGRLVNVSCWVVVCKAFLGERFGSFEVSSSFICLVLCLRIRIRILILSIYLAARLKTDNSA